MAQHSPEHPGAGDPARLPPLLVLRHGETEWNRVGRMQGHLDSPLTRTGRAQALRQRDILRDLGLSADWRWLSSPQERALATARIASEGLDVEIAIDDRLAEINVGDWTGASREDIRAARPDLFEKTDLGWYDHAPGGEGLLGLASRCAALLRDLDGPTVIVTHGITSRVIRCLATGRPYGDFVDIGGGQGVIYRIRDGRMDLLE